jgi:chemotaxis protein MotB
VDQVGQVRGFADRQLRHPEDPTNASNRRISVIVQYLPSPAGGKGAAGKPDAVPEGGGEAKTAAAAQAPANSNGRKQTR